MNDSSLNFHCPYEEYFISNDDNYHNSNEAIKQLLGIIDQFLHIEYLPLFLKLQRLKYLSNFLSSTLALALALQLLLLLSQLSIDPYQSQSPASSKTALVRVRLSYPVFFDFGFEVLYLTLFFGFLFTELEVDVSYQTLDEALLSYYLSSAIWLRRSLFSKRFYPFAQELGLFRSFSTQRRSLRLSARTD